MMTILACKAGKRYNREWIFKELDYRFEAGGRYAITGPNGSGKSTLLQVLAGAITLSAGTITCHAADTDRPLENDDVYRHLALAAPYMELMEEMTFTEFLVFHNRFKPFYNDISIQEAAAITGLEKALHKPIVQFSSGMKQRLKLAQAFFSNTEALFLDEPTSNLDRQGIDLYGRLIEEYTRHRLLIISSNDEVEYATCDRIIRIEDYKK